VALAGALLAAFTVRVPYYEFRPGSLRSVDPVVAVDDVETYPPSGEISYPTVSLSRSTVASYVWAWFDDDIDVFEEEVVLDDRSPDENRRYNLQLMDLSKQEAIRAALVTLGYEVPVTIEGVTVVGVQEGSGADGVISEGDTIVSIDGRRLEEMDDVSAALEGKGPGTRVEIGIEPLGDGGSRTAEVVLGADEDDPDRGLIGVRLQPRNPQFRFPIDIDIESGDVGGPSAGLAFSLTVIDLLTPGELTGDLQVAVTGDIDGSGQVDPVGGPKQKTAVVTDEGYDVFLVPREEVAEVADRAGDDLEVIGVDDLDDAVDALTSLGGSGIDTAR
jgi:Lon-like protease